MIGPSSSIWTVQLMISNDGVTFGMSKKIKSGKYQLATDKETF